jgi:hypothetical protein
MNSLPPRSGSTASTNTSKTTSTNLFAVLPILGAGLRKLLWIALFVWLLGTLGLGWLVKGVVVVSVMLIAVPIAGIFVGQWWLRKNVVQGACPVCSYELTGLNGTQLSCANCGEPLRVENRQFRRMSADGAIDVTAVDVEVQAVDVTVDVMAD